MRLREKKVYLASSSTLYFYIVSSAQDRNPNLAGTWKQELMPSLWGSDASWLASRALLSLLAYRTQGHHPRGVPTCTVLDLPSLITN